MKVNYRAREKQPKSGTSLVVEEKDGLISLWQALEPTSIWIVDSGCSNHMMGDRSLFSSLDESLKVSVRLSNDKEMIVRGIGIMSVST